MLRKLFAPLLTLCLMVTLFSVPTPAYAATANTTFAFGDSGSNITISIPTLRGKTTVTIAGKNATGIWETYEKEVLIASAPKVGDSLYTLTDTSGKRQGDYMNFSGAYFPVGKGLHIDEESWSAEAKAVIGNGLIATGQYMGDMMNFVTKSSYTYPSYDKDFPYIYSLVTDLGNTIYGINGENLGSDILVVPSSLLSNYKISALPGTKPSNAVTASFTASTIYINGTAVAFDAYLINGNNYIKLRDVATKLSGTQKQFEVTWDGTANAIALQASNSYTSVGGEMQKSLGATYAIPTTSKILLNGSEIKLMAYNIGGNNYFKLRDLGSALNFSVEWDATSKSVKIDSGKPYVEELKPEATNNTTNYLTVGEMCKYVIQSYLSNDTSSDYLHYAKLMISEGYFAEEDSKKYDDLSDMNRLATRAELARVLTIYYVLSKGQTYLIGDVVNSYSDLSKSDEITYFYCNAAVHYGLMTTPSKNKFDPTGNFTKEELFGGLTKVI